MADYILSGCSAADLSKEHFERIGVRYICFHYMMDDVLYPDDLGQTLSADEFYARMAKGAVTKTSQINISEYVDYFTSPSPPASPAPTTPPPTRPSSSRSASRSGRSTSSTLSALPPATD